MFDQELREGERRHEGESFKKFAVRRLLVALLAVVGLTVFAFLLITVLGD